jgi:hypothetical protein
MGVIEGEPEIGCAGARPMSGRESGKHGHAPSQVRASAAEVLCVYREVKLLDHSPPGR